LYDCMVQEMSVFVVVQVGCLVVSKLLRGRPFGLRSGRQSLAWAVVCLIVKKVRCGR